MILKFGEYQSTSGINFNEFGQINESHRYSHEMASVMDKLTFYVKRNIALESSGLNESAKNAYRKDIYFNRDERIAAACIFNEMVSQYRQNMMEELSIYETIISRGSLLKEGVEYDSTTLSLELSLDENKLVKFIKKGKEGVAKVAKSVIDGAKDLTVKTIDVVKAKKDDLVAWAKQAKEEFEERFEAFKDLVGDIVEKGIDSVQKFINKILDVFTSIGDNLVDAVKKLGGLKMEKGEKPAQLNIEGAEGLYKNAQSDEEKSFINNIILRVESILNKDKENAAKLMTESYVAESVVDNKFIAWLAGYKNDGTKMSWWKCLLIGICASLIVWLLPKVLVFTGVGAALAAFIAALVGVIWNGLGMLKLIYRRNKERKQGERFFNKQTGIFFFLSLLANVFSVATFLKTVGPLMREICNAMEWTGGDNMSKFGEFIFKITKKISPKDAFHEGGFDIYQQQIINNGGDFRGADLFKSKDDVLATLKDMPGVTETQLKAVEKFLEAPLDAKGTSAVYDALSKFANNPDLPMVNVFDTSKWGGSGPIAEAIKFFQEQGTLPTSATFGTLGSAVTQEASKGQYGFVSYLMGVNKDQANMIFQKACEIAGKDMSTLQIHTYGTGVIADSITITEKIKGFFDVLAPDIPFLPMVMPFFDKKKWGDYKMRFASSTRGAAAYVVDRVEMIPNSEVEKLQESSAAVGILKQLHDRSWKDYQEFSKEEPEMEENKNTKDKKKDVEEPQYIAFYIRANEETGHEPDKLYNKKKKNNDKPVEEGLLNEKKKFEGEVAIGVIFDTLTMMCADVCNFNKSVEVRRRPQPYFIKGMFSRLSFRPNNNRDNETKEFIRQTLGQTVKTLVSQCALYGMGRKYIDSNIDKNNATFVIRQTTLGDNKNIDENKAMFDLGNFSPKELLNCLDDKSASNKVAYDFLDGSFGSKITIRKDSDGNIKSTSAVTDSATIENVKYYRVSKEQHKSMIDAYNEEMEAFKNGERSDKPKRPTFIKGEDKEYYKRASKKWLANRENNKKKLFDFVDIRIIPLLKSGKLHDELIKDEKFKKMLYKENDSNGIELNKEVIDVLKPFLFRPEKTFAKDDEYELTKLLNSKGVEGEHLGWFKNLFKDEEQLHDTFKDLVEGIWEYLQDNRREIFKSKDFKPNHGKNNENYENLTRFDLLIEDFINEDYDEETEYKYDMMILNEQKQVLSFDDYLIERW